MKTVVTTKKYLDELEAENARLREELQLAKTRPNYYAYTKELERLREERDHYRGIALEKDDDRVHAPTAEGCTCSSIGSPCGEEA